MPAGYPEVERLVAHRAPMLLLLDVRSELEDGVVCGGAIPPGHPLADGPRAPAVLGIELAAQAAAACEGLCRMGSAGRAGAAPMGYLVSIKRSRFRQPFLPVGETLVATVRRRGGAGPLSSWVAVVSRAGSRRAAVVACRFSTFGLQRDAAGPA